MTKEDVGDSSGEGEQECWFGEKGYHESNEMESDCYSKVGQASHGVGIYLSPC